MTDILSLITSSFLSEKNKEVMKSLFQARGADEAFFQAFNKLLVDELGRRGKGFEMAIKEFDRRSLEAENTYHAEIASLEAGLDRLLSGLTPDDVVKKEALWREYYASELAARVKYEEAMRKIASEVILQSAH